MFCSNIDLFHLITELIYVTISFRNLLLNTTIGVKMSHGTSIFKLCFYLGLWNHIIVKSNIWNCVLSELVLYTHLLLSDNTVGDIFCKNYNRTRQMYRLAASCTKHYTRWNFRLPEILYNFVKKGVLLFQNFKMWKTQTFFSLIL